MGWDCINEVFIDICGEADVYGHSFNWDELVVAVTYFKVCYVVGEICGLLGVDGGIEFGWVNIFGYVKFCFWERFNFYSHFLVFQLFFS